MHTETVRLVTIVAESAVVESLLGGLRRLRVSGYTLTDARGEGSRGMRVGEIPGDNRKIEVLVGAEVAEQILDLLESQYFPNYAVVAWVSEVIVARRAKYAST